MHHIPQDSWARLTVRLVSPAFSLNVEPDWFALLFHYTLFIVKIKGVSLVFFEIYFRRRKSLQYKGLRRAGQPR